MKSYNTFSLVSTIVLLGVLACTMEEPFEMSDPGDIVRVPVSLNLEVSELTDGTPWTKTIMEPDNSVSSDAQIQNFVVVQFDGVAGNSRCLGGAIYIDHWPLRSMLDSDDDDYDENDVVTLAASSSACAVVVLANTFGGVSVTSSTTLSSFLKAHSTISDLSQLLVESDGNQYLRMSGSTKLTTVTSGTSVSVALKRNLAKIIINVTNNSYSQSAANQISFSEVQLKGLNGNYYYFTHVDDAITAVDGTVRFEDPYTAGSSPRFDNDRESFPAAKNPRGANEGDTQVYTYYVPANLRGTVTNTYEYAKGSVAPEGSTYFRIYGQYGSGTPINYTYYLGENFTDDFNLKPNYRYTYDIDINSKGYVNFDNRIEDMGETVFSTDANCYMLHPPTVAGQSRVYAIPVRRAAVFWNLTAEQDPDNTVVSWHGTYGGSNLTGFTDYNWDENTEWTAEVLWSTISLSGYAPFVEVSSGKGFDPDTPPAQQPVGFNPFFKVRVSAGMEGSVIVAVKVGGTIQWSWHFWITSYDPDQNIHPAPDKYIYDVRDGAIHRYKGKTASSIWNITPTESKAGLADGFIMDRQIGARVPNGTGLCYQWGRKDPFTSTIYLAGSSSSTYWSTDASRRVSYTATGVTDNKNIRYTVVNPMILLTGTLWTSNDDELGAGTDETHLWGDPLFWEHNSHLQTQLEIKKSIYDPCPPGWKVVYKGAFDDFSISPTAGYTTVWDAANHSRIYYPGGYENRGDDGGIIWRAQGFFNNSAVTQDGSYGYFWTSSLGIGNNAITSGNSFTSSNVNVFPSLDAYNKSRGQSLRCIHE